MALTFNLTGNGYFAVPGGYPVRLWAGCETSAGGVIPAGVASVSVTLYAEAGTASAHLGAFAMPTTPNGTDGAVVVQTDATLTTTVQTMTLSLPDVTAEASVPYVVRLWVDGVTGVIADAYHAGVNLPAGVVVTVAYVS